MTIRKRPTSRYTSHANYTQEELAAMAEADRRADLEAERRYAAEAPAREAAARAESIRRASMPQVSFSIPMARGKITLYKGWEIEHDKNGWLVHYPDRGPAGGGKYLSTLRDAKRYIDNY